MKSQELFKLIVSESPFGLLDLAGPPAGSSGRSTMVYLPAGSAELLALPPDHKPRLRDRLKRPYWRYEIDVAHHPAWLTLQLPAAEEAFSFTARVCFTWTVTDAVAVARYGIRDGRPIIWRYLDQLLRTISRLHEIERCAEAEDEMNERLGKESGELGYGLRLSELTVDLELDENAKQHLVARADVRRAREIAIDNHELQVLRKQHEHLQAERAGELERAQAQHTINMARNQAAHELELKKQRVAFYDHELGGNRNDFVLLQLIEHPEDIRAVVEMMRSGEQVHYDRFRNLLEKLMDKGLVHGGDVEALLGNAIEHLSTGGSPAAAATDVTIGTKRHTTIVTDETAVTTLNLA